MNRLLVLAVLCVAASVLASSANARLVRPLWTTSQAESVVFDTDWAYDNAVDDLSCVGRGRSVLNPANQPTCRTFRCSFYYQDTEDQEQTFTAYLRVIGNPDRYSLYGWSDDFFNPNSGCYEQTACFGQSNG